MFPVDPSQSPGGSDLPIAKPNPPPGLYDDLRRLARTYLTRQPPNHTLQPTALVHEAYARLLRRDELESLQRRDIFALAANAMRSVLVDHARSRGRQKRGGAACRVPLDDVVDLYEDRALDLICLDDSLERLALSDPDQARVVELRFFGGLTEEEAAGVLGVSTRTVGRLWRRARAWLRSELSNPHGVDERTPAQDR